jgi:hypothetical protein
MLNKLSNGEKITKNRALQREIWRSEIGPAARVFQKNPRPKVEDEPEMRAPPLVPGGAWWSVKPTPSSVRPPVSSVVILIIYFILIKFLIIFMVIKIINNYFLNKNINRGGPLVHVAESEVLSGLEIFCALLWELRGPISMGGEIFWNI